MTTIKGFVDGILDGTIPPDMQNHYLQLVSEETGRLAGSSRTCWIFPSWKAANIR